MSLRSRQIVIVIVKADSSCYLLTCIRRIEGLWGKAQTKLMFAVTHYITGRGNRMRCGNKNKTRERDHRKNSFSMLSQCTYMSTIISFPLPESEKNDAMNSTLPHPFHQFTQHIHAYQSISIYLFPALLAFPGLFFAPPPPVFIFFCEKPLRSPLLIASPLFLNLFFPPWPYLASFFARLFGPSLPPRDDLSLEVSSSRATSKRSASWVSGLSAPWRSVGKKCVSKCC